MHLLLLEGANSIGGTKIYLQEKDVGVLLDWGINYGRWGLYFEEYLKPRVGRGLYDLWTLDLIPKVEGLYRADLIPGDFRPAYEHNLDIQALFLSHAHLDHCGVVGLVHDDIPLYTSAVSAAIMKAMQDSGKLEYYGEIAYRNPRVPKKDGLRTLETTANEPYRGRRLYSVHGGASELLQRFWQMPPNPKALVPKSRAKKLEPQPLEPASNTIKGLRFQAMPVDHSIPGAVGFTFEAEEGIIVYSRDIRLHGTQGEQTRRFEEIVAQQKPYLLIIEGTRLGRETITNVTEQQVLESALAIVRASGGKLVIADFGPRHIERLATFLAIARETNRLLVITTKDGYLLEAIAAADAHLNLLDDPALGILDELRLASLGWEEDFRQRHQHRLIRPEDVHSDHSRYLLALSFYDMNDLLDIHPHGSVYIYSSSEAYGEDQRVDAWRLWNWLRFYQMEVHGLRWVGNDEHGHPAFPGQLHASGHITADDLLWLIQEIQPRYVLPVHTQHPEWFVQQLSGEPIQVVPTTNGQWFQTPV